MSPIKAALRVDRVLTAVIAGGFTLLLALLIVGVTTQQWAAIAGFEGVIGTIIGGSMSALVVIATTKDGGSKKDE